MDRDVARWIAELIWQATSELPSNPGLTIEVDHDKSNWVQVIPEERGEEPGSISGFVANFPHRFGDGAPLDVLREAGVRLSPDTTLMSHEAGSYDTLWIRPDIPLGAFALLLGDIFERIGGGQHRL